MLTLQIKEKEIENLTPEEEFVRGTVGAKCQINFDEFWQGYEKYIVFKRVGYEPINIMVNSLENEIEIPYTILAESGEFKIGVFGITETETLPTLYSKDIKILYGTDTHGTTPPTYIPSEIDQLRLSKQDKLVSGENIKTVNGESVLGSGNIGIKFEVDQTYDPDSTNAQSGTAVAEALSGYVVAEVGKGLSSNDFTNEDKEKLYSALQNENIDKTYTPDSSNAQSGKAVAEAVSTEQNRANNTFANALKGTKSDTAMLLDDISSVTHDMGVKVRGKNLLNQSTTELGTLAYGYAPSYTRDFEDNTWYAALSLSGYYDPNNSMPEYALNGDSITVKTGTAESLTLYGLSKALKCRPNTTYTLSYIMENGKTVNASGIGFYGVDKKWLSYVYCDSGSSFTTPSNCYWIIICFHGNKEDTYVTYSDIQLELGTTPTDYTPYVPDLTAVKVKKQGKNLLPPADSGIYYNGSIASGNPFIANSSYSISDFNDIDISKNRGVYAVIKLTEGETYTLTVNNLVNNCATKQITFAVGFRSSESTIFGTSEANNTAKSSYNPSSFTFTVPKGFPYCLVGLFNYPTVSGDTISFDTMHLELGAEATDYEPYITPTEYTPNADGTVEGVLSLYPNTTLTTDTEGVLIDCEYNRDINKAFAELQQAIISLGGNV